MITPLRLTYTFSAFTVGQGKISQSQAVVAGWNVNGLRNVVKRRTLHSFLNTFQPDWLCLNSLKVSLSLFNRKLPFLKLPTDYQHYWSCQRKSLSVMVLTRHVPLAVFQDLPGMPEKGKGRVLVLQYETFYLVNVDKPNIGFDKAQLPFKIAFDQAFNNYMAHLANQKAVVIYGDMNVAHQDIDLAQPEKERECTGCTSQEREGFNKLIQLGFRDTFRELHPSNQSFTFWTFQVNGNRRNNIGFRFDYVLTSSAVQIQQATIHSEVQGSDHCPVSSRFQVPSVK